MTLLTVVKDVCAAVGVTLPGASVFSNISSNRTMQEMVALANEMAQRIAYDNRDWTTLRTIQLGGIMGTGLTVAHPLPVNFKRMLLTGNVWRSTDYMTPMRFIPDTDEWLNRRARVVSEGGPGEWTLLSGEIFIDPVLQVDEAVHFPYMDKNCVRIETTPSSGGYTDTFTRDGDSFRLDERLLKLGMIWQWKAQKGSPYAEDMGTYGDALTYAMGHDSPSPIVIGRQPISANTRVAYPWPVPT
jgi:hypothetical protein